MVSAMEGHDEHKERRHFFGAAKLIAGITMCSRVTGLLRDMILSWTLGATDATSAFWMAFTVPNCFRRLFGEGAFSGAFVPVFSSTTENEGRESAAKLLANVLGWLGMFLCVLCLVVELGLLATYLAFPGDWTRQLTLGYTALMMPFMVTICMLALGSAALNCVGHFAYPAAAPIIMNICFIVGAGVVAPLFEESGVKLTVVSLSAVGSGILQLVLLIWVLRAHNLPFVPSLRPLHPGIRKIVTHMAPMLIPLGILQFTALLDKVIARVFAATSDSDMITLFGWTFRAPLRPEAVTWMSYGERLYQLPLGVLALALATAVFPLFSRYAARGDMVNLRKSINRSLRLAIFEGLPSGVGLILLGQAIATLFFARGRYTAYDAAETAHVAWFFGLGMWAFCMQHILLRAYFALNDRMTPLKIACTMVVVNLSLSLTFIWIPCIRHGAFGLSASITTGTTVLILTWRLRKKLGRVGFGGLIRSVLRTGVATAAMAIAVWQAKALLGRLGLTASGFIVAGGMIAGAAAFFGVCLLLRAPEMKELFTRSGKKKTE